MVNSVGPNRFSTIELGAAACHASALARGSGSPQNKLHRSSGMLDGRSELFLIISAATEGTENHSVRRCAVMKRAGASMSILLGTHSAAPACQAMNMSKTDKSNVWSKVCDKRSSRVNWYRRDITSMKCSALPCVTPTPLGSPVV